MILSRGKARRAFFHARRAKTTTHPASLRIRAAERWLAVLKRCGATAGCLTIEEGERSGATIALLRPMQPAHKFAELRNAMPDLALLRVTRAALESVGCFQQMLAGKIDAQSAGERTALARADAAALAFGHKACRDKSWWDQTWRRHEFLRGHWHALSTALRHIGSRSRSGTAKPP